MKTTKKFLTFILLLTLLLPINIYAKTVDEDFNKLSSTDPKDYSVIIGYDEQDEEEIFSDLTDKEKDDFIKNKTKEVFEYISKGENDKIEKLRKENPKLDIIIQKSFSEKNTNVLEDTNFSNTFVSKVDDVEPYANDTDTYVSTKRFTVSSNSGQSYANCVASIRVDRNLNTRKVTIVNIKVTIKEHVGKFGFTPVYNGNNTARLSWAYLGPDSLGQGNINFKAYFNKTVDMY